MNDEADKPNEPNADDPNHPNDASPDHGDEATSNTPASSEQFTQQVQHAPVAARVPDEVSRGVFSTGVLVQTGRHEFVLDFLLMVVRPHQVVSRIILPFGVVPGFITALRQNLDAFTQRFGPPPALPKPAQPTPAPAIDEIYGQLKLPDETAGGIYANTVMITHSPSEFVFDFITTFYPRSMVASRVFLTVPQIPRFLESLTRSFDQLQKRMNPPRPPQGPTPGDGGDDLPRPPGPESMA